MDAINTYAQKLQKQENNVKMIVFVIVNIVDFIINKKYYNILSQFTNSHS